MTENRSGYATNCLHLSTSTDKLEQVRQEEAERIHNLPRDELVYQVDGETDSQQELIERLAEMVIEADVCEGDECDVAKELALLIEYDKELKARNHRLNERVRELDYALMQCEEDKALAETQRDEARQWARDLLARIGNLDWLVGRLAEYWKEDVAELEKQIAELKQPEPDTEEMFEQAIDRLNAAKRPIATLAPVDTE